MASTSMATERSLRLTLKLLQFLVSLYLIFSLYNTGPHWILLIACLAVPVYGIYLMVKSPDRTLRQHPVPFVRYKALVRNKNWLRVDVAISLTMAVVCCGFSAILFFGYFKVSTATSFYLQAAVASLLLCILYLFNAMLSTRQIEMGTIDFIIDNEKQPFSTQLSRTSPLAVNTDFGQAELYFQEGGGVPKNNNMPQSHKCTVSSLTLLERLQVELARRKQQDPPPPEAANKHSIGESSQEYYLPSAKTSRLSDFREEEEGNQDISTTQLKYKYSEPTQDFNPPYLEAHNSNKAARSHPPEVLSHRKMSEMPPSSRQLQQSLERKRQSISSSISSYKISSQPYNRRAVPAASLPKTSWSMADNGRYQQYDAAEQRMYSTPKKSEAGEHQPDGPSSILKKSSASMSPREFTLHSSTNSSNASNHPSSSCFTTYMPVYSRKLETVEPIRTDIHRAVPVKAVEGDHSQSDSSTGDSADSFGRRMDAKGSSQTVQSSQGSTVRVEDFDPQTGSTTSNTTTATPNNRIQGDNSGTVDLSADPIPPIAAAIDSGRERQRLGGGGTRLREKINSHKSGFDGIRPRSMPFRHSTELKIETGLTGIQPASQVTQF